MFGFFTIVAFVIAWNAGKWWLWFIAITMGLAWLGKQQQEKEKAAAASLPVSEPVQKPAVEVHRGDVGTQSKQLDVANDWVMKLTEICSNYSASDFYVAELIPEQKLKNATKTYPLPDGGSPVALIDTTLFGAADDGLLIGEHGLSWHNLATETKVSSLRWKEFAATTLSLDGSKIKFGGIGVFDTTGNGLGKEKIIELLGAVQVGYADYGKRVKPATTDVTRAEKVTVVEVNRAPYDDLLSLPGIGAAEAKMILARRESVPFQSLDSLADFLDLKPHKADQLRVRVAFSEPDRLPIIQNPESPPVINQAPNHVAPPPAVANPVISVGGGRVID